MWNIEKKGVAHPLFFIAATMADKSQSHKRKASSHKTKAKKASSGAQGSNLQPEKCCKVTVTSEEEDNTLYSDSIIIKVDKDGNEKGSNTSSEAETSEVELGECSQRFWALINYSIVDRLKKDWMSLIYAFFDAPTIEYIKKRRCHVFACFAKGCKQKLHCFLDTKDSSSTSNMRKHVHKCWGEETVKLADSAKGAAEVQDKLIGGILWDGSIMMAFEHKEKGQVTYSHCQHTKIVSYTHLLVFCLHFKLTCPVHIS